MSRLGRPELGRFIAEATLAAAMAFLPHTARADSNSDTSLAAVNYRIPAGSTATVQADAIITGDVYFWERGCQLNCQNYPNYPDTGGDPDTGRITVATIGIKYPQLQVTAPFGANERYGYASRAQKRRDFRAQVNSLFDSGCAGGLGCNQVDGFEITEGASSLAHVTSLYSPLNGNSNLRRLFNLGSRRD